MADDIGFEDAYSILAYKLAFGEAIKQDKIEKIKQFKSAILVTWLIMELMELKLAQKSNKSIHYQP